MGIGEDQNYTLPEYQEKGVGPLIFHDNFLSRLYIPQVFYSYSPAINLIILPPPPPPKLGKPTIVILKAKHGDSAL